MIRINKKFGLYMVGFLFPAYAFFQLASLNTLANSLILSFSMAPSSISHLSSLYLFVDAICLIPAGLLLDKINLKILIPIALLFLIMGIGVVAISQNVPQLYIGKALAGAGHAFAFLTGFKLTKKCLPEKYQAIGISFVVTFAMLGGLMAQMPLEVLIIHLGWRLAVLSNCLLGLILLIFSFFMLRCVPLAMLSQESSEKYTLKDFYSIFLRAAKTPANYFIGLVVGLLSAPLILLGSTIGNLYLTEVLKVSIYHSSLVSIFLFLSTAIGMLLFGWLGDRYQHLIFLLFSSTFLAALIVGLSLIFMSNYTVFMLGLLFFLIAFFSSVQTLAYVLVYKYNTTASCSTAMAFTNVVIMLVCASIPLIASLFNLSHVMYILAAFFILALLAISIIKKLHPLQAA